MADAKQFLVKLQGRDYMQVPGRVIMFREAHPHGAISTDIVAVGDFLLAKAFVHDGDGRLMATGHATVRSGQGQKWSGREIEKAETAAIGRALGLAGFGTADADDDDGYLADTPQPPRPTPPQSPPSTLSGVFGGQPDANAPTFTDAEDYKRWAAQMSKKYELPKDSNVLSILGVERPSLHKGGKAAAEKQIASWKASA